MARIRCTHPSGAELQIGCKVDDGTGTGTKYWWPDPAKRITLKCGETEVPDEFWDEWWAQYQDEHRPGMMLLMGITRLDHGGPDPRAADPESH